MAKFFEVASYADPKYNEDIPLLLDFEDRAVPEAEVAQVVKRMFDASPVELRDDVAVCIGRPTVEVWNVQISEVGIDEDGRTDGYVRDAPGAINRQWMK